MLALYHFDRSTAAQKVRLSLAEKGLEWESRIINPGLNSREQHDPEYLRLNPRGVGADAHPRRQGHPRKPGHR